MRTVVRTLMAGFLALAGPVLAAPAAAAHVQEAQQSARTDSASSHQLTISIDALNPSFATPSSTVTVSGTVTNDTGSPLQGIQVQLLTEDQDFLARSQMDSYAAGSNSVMSPLPIGTPYVVPGTVRSGSTVRWSASFSAAAAYYGATFGVYPLEAQAESAGGTPLAAERTFLPFWPGNDSADPLSTAWLWPLIDEPQQGPCPQTLATNSLAASLRTGGRLDTLLAVGEQWAQQDELTWVVDPALLSDAQLTAQRHFVGGNATCTGAPVSPASAAAASWLAALRTGTAGEPVVVTPYADADVAALTRAGLDANVRTAYQLGESVARKILNRPFGMAGNGPGDGGSAALAWPAGGTADASLLTSLATNGGISTVVLNSGEMTSTDAPYDNALAATTTGTGTEMGVLLADSELTSVLGSASAGAPAGAQFAAEQDFVAQTAMIAAEAPYQKRSLVLAPPQRWDPPAAEAERLLSLTSSLPWLHPVGLSSLASAADDLKARQPLAGSQVDTAELGSGYLSEVRSVDSSLALYTDLLYQPSASMLQTLDAAAVGTESSAWRGAGGAAGSLALTKLADYLRYWEQKVQILAGTKLLLGGASGPAPISVQNAGQLPVQVGVEVIVPPGSGLSVANPHALIVVPAGKTGTVTMTMYSSGIGTTTLQLQLVTKNGLPLTWRGASQSLSVEATHYGRALLVLIAAALGALVLTSMARWIRRWRNDGRVHGRSGGAG
ncbi:DUF6049 family protein [Trebonia sp.]|uniref:DUF6049 family protein n=1 Tax=Trebonia sp. TaxID=2767075 RepID=UPI0026346466|nr:DUF6049 family protein [Trebonia sp.]